MRRAAWPVAALILLTGCGGTDTPVEGPTEAPVPSQTATRKTVQPGAFCDEHGATGKSESGRKYVCRQEDGEWRWRRPVG